MLPTFLGIGAQRCGTSWLDTCLRTHPQVFLPASRKEVHFFDAYFDRGTDWYKKFFKEARASHLAVGEITPSYMFLPGCRDRIRAVLGEQIKFIVLLRNPVDRAFSQYTAFCVTAGLSPRSFADFLEQQPDALERGNYGRHLAHFSELFPKQAFLVLIHEEVHASRESERHALEQICRHLGVEPSALPLLLPAAVGRSLGRPRWAGMLRSANAVRGWLGRNDHDWLVNVVKRLGVKRLFYSSGDATLPMLDREMRQQLEQYYQPDLHLLEDWLGRELGPWKRPPA